jgi:hypothetical protein
MSAKKTPSRAIIGTVALFGVALALAGSALAVALKPAISSFTPTSAKPAATITLKGKHFTGAKMVKVDGMTAKFKVVSPTKLTVTIPSKAKSGKIAVTTAGGTATSSLKLTVA